MLLPHGELEIAARGSRPGGGAVAALESAGDNGSVLVAWEQRPRDAGPTWAPGLGPARLHSIGVLARAVPMPAIQAFRLPGGAPGGPALEGVARWKLRGVRRALVDAGRVSEGEPPTILVELLDERPEDAMIPPREYLDALAELTRAWSGGDQWRVAFELMARSPLGQWATSLGTLLPADDDSRFVPLDHPQRLRASLRETLDRLLELQARRQLPE